MSSKHHQNVESSDMSFHNFYKDDTLASPTTTPSLATDENSGNLSSPTNNGNGASPYISVATSGTKTDSRNNGNGENKETSSNPATRQGSLSKTLDFIHNLSGEDAMSEIENVYDDYDSELQESFCCNYWFCNKCCPCIDFSFLCMIFDPMGTFRTGWNIIVTIVLLYTCIEIPYTLSFEIELTLSHWSGIVAFSIDIFLLIDIIINFRTAYFENLDNLRLVKNPKKIAKKFRL